MTDTDKPIPHVMFIVGMADRERDDSCSAVIHATMVRGFERLFIQQGDAPGGPAPEAVELDQVLPTAVEALITGIRAHTYRHRRQELLPRPRDHQQRKGRRPGPCHECDATGWIALETREGGPLSTRRAVLSGEMADDLAGVIPVRTFYAWTPCPRCDQPREAA